MIPKATYQAFFKAIYSVILNKEKSNKTSVEKLASSFGITDKNTIKEITETAIVTIARKIANQKNKSVKERYDEIVDLYKSQVNLSHRTSQSMLLQQYSTPATIGFLMGIYCEIDRPGNYYEPSAGNGMLTIANTGKDFTVNEIDATRFQNLEFQDVFKLITKNDSSRETYKSKYFDAIITNPPFSTLNKDEYLTLGEYEIKHLDHKMAILALNSMKDNGKAAIIVGGHTSWDDKGRIQAGKNRIFLSYLYKNYNVEDVILIDGNALYSKMGTGFDTRIILINGRKAKPEGFAPLKNDVLAQVIKTTDDLYDRFAKPFEELNTDDDEVFFNTIGDKSPTVRMFQRSEDYFKNYIKNLSNYQAINNFTKENNSRWNFNYTIYDIKNKDLEFELKDLLNQLFRSKYDLFLIKKQLPYIEKKYPNKNVAKKLHQEAKDFYQNKLQNEKSYRATLVAIDYVMQRLKGISSTPTKGKALRLRAKAIAIKQKQLLISI